MTIDPLLIPVRTAASSTGYAEDMNLVSAKINELATAMGISKLTIAAAVGAGNPAADMNQVVAKVNELIGGGGTTPAQVAITSIDPSTAKVGDTIIINGSGFTGALNVLFAGVAAGVGKFSVLSDSQITVVVPSIPAGGNPVQVVGSVATSPARAFLVQAAANAIPVATANQPGNVVQPASQVSLVGSGTDSDGTVVAHEWRQVTGPVNVSGLPATTATVLVTGLTGIGTYQFGYKVKDNSGGYSAEQFVNVSVVPAGGLTTTLTASVTTAPAGTPVTYTANVTGGTATYVQFRKPDGTNLGITNTFPATLALTSKDAGVQEVIAYAIDANGVNYPSSKVTVQITQAQAVAPQRSAAVVGRWDARVKGLDGNGNWLEADGGQSLVAVGGSMSIDATGVKGLPGIVCSQGKGFEFPAIDWSTKNDFSVLCVGKFNNPGSTQDQILVATKPYQYGQKGGFVLYAKENYYAGAGDSSISCGMLFGDYNSFSSVPAKEFDILTPTAVTATVSPKNTTASLQVNGENLAPPQDYVAFGADLLNQALQVLQDCNITVLGYVLFNGATADEKQAWKTYYDNLLGNSVDLTLFLAEDAILSNELLVPNNNPAGVYGTGTRWVLETTTPTADVSVIPGISGAGVWLDGVQLQVIKTPAPTTINLGSAGVKRLLEIEMGPIEGQNSSENSITSGGLRSIRTQPGSVSAWVQKPRKKKLLIIFCNSIGVGGITEDGVFHGVFQELALLLAPLGWDVVWDGWGNRAWGGGMTSAAERGVTTTRWKQRAVGYDVVAVYDELGTNDTTSGGTANQVAQWRVDLIAAAKAAISTVKYLVQTPMGRNTEFDSIGGRGTIEDYYQASKAAVGAAYPDVPVYDGRLFMTSGEAGDGVHPARPYTKTIAKRIFDTVFKNM